MQYPIVFITALDKPCGFASFAIPYLALAQLPLQKQIKIYIVFTID